MWKENTENFMVIAFTTLQLLDFKVLPFFVFQAKIRHFELTFYIIDLEQMIL